MSYDQYFIKQCRTPQISHGSVLISLEVHWKIFYLTLLVLIVCSCARIEYLCLTSFLFFSKAKHNIVHLLYRSIEYRSNAPQAYHPSDDICIWKFEWIWMIKTTSTHPPSWASCLLPSSYVMGRLANRLGEHWQLTMRGISRRTRKLWGLESLRLQMMNVNEHLFLNLNVWLHNLHV